MGVTKQPREWTTDPDNFGKHAHTSHSWKQPRDGWEAAAIDAAKIQHEIVVALRDALPQTRPSFRPIATRIGMTYQQFTRVTRGQAGMTLWHIAALERQLGRFWRK